MMDELLTYTNLQWLLVVGSSLILFAVSPLARTAGAFYQGTRRERAPGVVALTSSLVISWLFAKSITNAANLGLSFGWIGGAAYAAYYVGFAVAGVVIYYLRTRGRYRSIHHFLSSRFGRGAVLLFSLLIGFRLFNEVWSNTMVIGSYFGDIGSTSYYVAILVFTALTLAYSLKGGMSSSILTDVIQMALFALLLTVVLGAILPRLDYDPVRLLSAGPAPGTSGWSGGINLLLVALLQSLSYPFHDPVLTDRGFLAKPRTSLKAFLWAVPLGAGCILLFSLVGVYGNLAGVQGQAPVEVARLLGGPLLLVMNFIMVTSAASTLDSTFSSFSKLAVIDLASRNQTTATVGAGRWAMAGITLVGTLPVFLDPAILSATTVSGAMVVGLAPVFCLWWLPVPRVSFFASVGGGLVFGTIYAFGLWPTEVLGAAAPYADLLSVTVVSLVVCFLLYLLPLAGRIIHDTLWKKT
ncbi:Na+/proline symporter [Lewinella marina]|uniref:Sodium:solute symporter n=1 Tax=Neolewinella marina TaxID=438751 RepID=A0A2G0CFF4_9BACT|nr:sodium:solute symporter [Neolewinella marina]NJB85658.1 Na+/proline symporter [Neolewinella marina]PHK98660.1 sodium:solute symporter [Neolewinella marina]